MKQKLIEKFYNTTDNIIPIFGDVVNISDIWEYVAYINSPAYKSNPFSKQAEINAFISKVFNVDLFK